MLEKLLLAATLTFTLSLFAELNWFSSAQTATENNRQSLPTFTLTQQHNSIIPHNGTYTAKK
jgi:hypothetical protein